ncbi:CPBP family intramembrane glutamic endopeptidase [Halocatena halophila]|uniref:CPBP family intramembrane glutamic endopeptidase n=1 Tax=Halocatena halophila TaxID=2814576 RepID=UPI002ED098C9
MNRLQFDDRLRVFALASSVAVSVIILSRIVMYGIDRTMTVASLSVPRWGGVLLSIGIQQGVIFLGACMLFLRWRGLSTDWLGISRPDIRGGLWIIGGWFGTLVGVVVVSIVVVFGVGVLPAQNKIGGVIASDPTIVTLLIPLMILVVGPSEELVFRGIVQGTLRERFGPVSAIGLSSLIFASVHFYSLTGAPLQRVLSIGLLLVPALVLGTAYERTGNIVVPSIIHGFYNATLLWLSYLSMKFSSEAAFVGTLWIW